MAELLGLGAWNEHGGRDTEVSIAEPRFAKDILYRLAFPQPCDDGIEALLLLERQGLDRSHDEVGEREAIQVF